MSWQTEHSTDDASAYLFQSQKEAKYEQSPPMEQAWEGLPEKSSRLVPHSGEDSGSREEMKVVFLVFQVGPVIGRAGRK